MAGVDRIPAGVSRQLWIEALELAGGDPDRIEVQSAASLVVHNTADWAAAARPATRRKPARKPAASQPEETGPDSGPMATVTQLPSLPQWTPPPRGRQHRSSSAPKAPEPGGADATGPAPITKAPITKAPITKAPAPKTEMPSFLAPASGSQ